MEIVAAAARFGDPPNPNLLGPTSTSVRVRNTFLEVVGDEESSDDDKQVVADSPESRRGSKVLSPTGRRRQTSAPPSPSRTKKPLLVAECSGSPAELSQEENASSETAPPTSSVSSRHNSLGSYEAWQEHMMLGFVHGTPPLGTPPVDSSIAEVCQDISIGGGNYASSEKSAESVGSVEAWPEMVGHDGVSACGGMPFGQDCMMSAEHLEAMSGYYAANAGMYAYSGNTPMSQDTAGMTLSTSPLSTAPPIITGMPMPWIGGYQMAGYDAARCAPGHAGGDFGLDTPNELPQQGYRTGSNNHSWSGRSSGPAGGAGLSKRTPKTMNKPLVPFSGRGASQQQPVERSGKAPADPFSAYPWLTPSGENGPSAVQQMRLASGKSKPVLQARDYGGGGGPKRVDYSKRSNNIAPVGSEAPNTSTPITTMMLRHIPCRKSQEEVMQHIDQKGFKGRYDFLYLPSDTRCGANLGYAFVNFLTEPDGARFKAEMHGYRFSGCGSAKACAVVQAHVQGLAQNLATFKNMEVMRSARKPFFLAGSRD